MTPPQLTIHTQKRLPKIKEGLLRGDNYPTIADACGVKEKTIDRDIKAWLQSGDFEDWIKTMWIELHGKITEDDPTEAYRQVSKLLSKMVTQKREIKSEGTLKLDGLDSAVQQIIKFSKEDSQDGS